MENYAKPVIWSRRLLQGELIHMRKKSIRDLTANYILCNGAAGFLDHEQVYKNLLDREQLDASCPGSAS